MTCSEGAHTKHTAGHRGRIATARMGKGNKETGTATDREGFEPSKGCPLTGFRGKHRESTAFRAQRKCSESRPSPSIRESKSGCCFRANLT
jgi:hypothetical protein